MNAPCPHCGCVKPEQEAWHPVAVIQREVAKAYNIPLLEMRSNRRQRDYARPRQVAMFLARKFTVQSLPEIGRRFGGRDHTTVIYAIKQVETLRKDDACLDEEVTALEHQLPPLVMRELVDG